MSLTAWFAKTFFGYPKTLNETEKVIKIQTNKIIHKIYYIRDSDYTYLDTLIVDGNKIKKGSARENMQVLSSFIFLKHNFIMETSHISRMQELCSVGISENINLANNITLQLKVVVK